VLVFRKILVIISTGKEGVVDDDGVGGCGTVYLFSSFVTCPGND
jgi:hypothetical protein